MSRFLKTIRFDKSDTFAFPVAAEPDEWAISGSFAFTDIPSSQLRGKIKQAFTNGFLGVSTFGHATFATVCQLSDADRDAIIGRLTHHFVDAYGAPGISEAQSAAITEVAFIEDLVSGCLINTLFCVTRELDDDGGITESYRKLERRIGGGPIYLGPQGPEES